MAASGVTATRRGVAYGLVPVAALAATVAVEAAERQGLAQAVDGIQSEFGISDFQVGLLPAAMTVVGVLGSIVIGILADRSRRTRLLSGAMVAWSVGMVASALAPGYAALVAARMAVGAVEGNGPAAVSLLGDYYPVRSRGRMFGLYQGGALVGTLVGLLAAGVAVSAGGWRWAFWIWVPVGLVVAVWVARIPEPARGDQDGDLRVGGTQADDEEGDPAGPPVAGVPDHGDPHTIGEEIGIGGLTSVDAAATLDLPAATRIGTLDYDRARLGTVIRELCRVRTMWFALMALTLSQFLLVGLQFWGVEFFKRAHGLSASGAAGFTAVFGLGAAAGVLLGGFISDRYVERGVVNARILVVAASSLAAPLVLVPAFLISNIWLTTPFFILGGLLLTAPVAPGEAVLNDVVVAPLRGRAASFRGVLRSLAALSPVLIGGLSDAVGLQDALALLTPTYAVGGVLMLLATRTYPTDLAFVAEESHRLRSDPSS